MRALLFGDVHGFSKLNDRELPLFAETGRGGTSASCRYLVHNTWDDRIFAFFEDVRAAAEWALEAQERVKAIDLAEAGLPGICTCAWAGTWALCIR